MPKIPKTKAPARPRPKAAPKVALPARKKKAANRPGKGCIDALALLFVAALALLATGCASLGPTDAQAKAAAAAHASYLAQQRTGQVLRARITPTDRVVERRVTYLDAAGAPQVGIDTGKIVGDEGGRGLIVQTPAGLVVVPLASVAGIDEVVTNPGTCGFTITGGELDIAMDAPLVPLQALGSDTTKQAAYQALESLGRAGIYAAGMVYGLDKLGDMGVGSSNTTNNYAAPAPAP